MMIMKGKTIIKEKLHYHYLMTCKYYILFIRDSKKKTDNMEALGGDGSGGEASVTKNARKKTAQLTSPT